MSKLHRIVDHLKVRSKSHSDKIFVADQYRSVTYGDFYEEVGVKARGLKSIGVECEDRIILVLLHGIDHLISYFACMEIGAIPVHLSTAKPKEGIIQAAKITTAKYAITQSYAHDLSGNGFVVLDYSEISSDIEYKDPTECSIAYMMFTSGTTGVPKAVMTSHSNTLATASSIIDFADISQNDRELISLPLTFTFGLGHIHALIIVGGQAYLTNRRYEIGYLARAIRSEQVSGFLASPGMLREMLKDHREALIRAGKNLRYLVVNCTPMETSLTTELLKILPNTQLYMYYGSTEASRCAFIHYNQNLNRLDYTGKHTLNVELKIDKPDTAGMGEICMRGPNVMPGYWNNEEATRNTIDEDNWFHSGDFGIMDDDGYVKVIGRMNDEISVDGMKCQPVEVEDVIQELPFVRQVTICAVPDKAKYQVVGAAIVSNEEPLPQNYQTLIRDHCEKRLEAYKVPVVITCVDRIPANELGKINRKELIEQLIPEIK